jgi:hypothetical protein
MRLGLLTVQTIKDLPRAVETFDHRLANEPVMVNQSIHEVIFFGFPQYNFVPKYQGNKVRLETSN